MSDYWSTVPAAKTELEAWFHEVKASDWTSPADIKSFYGNASILKGGRAVFNICGNRYRLVVWINYEFRTVYIRFIGTHSEYDAIDAEKI